MMQKGNHYEETKKQKFVLYDGDDNTIVPDEIFDSITDAKERAEEYAEDNDDSKFIVCELKPVVVVENKGVISKNTNEF